MSNTEWRTPPELFALLDRLFGPFTLDAAADMWNTQVLGGSVDHPFRGHLDAGDEHVKGYLTEEDDALATDWGAPEPDNPSIAFCNPPYANGMTLDFVEKGLEEIAAGHLQRAVFLTMHDTSTLYWKAALGGASHILSFTKRIPFLEPDGTPITGNRFDSAVLVFDPVPAGVQWEGPRRGVLHV